MTTLAKRLWIGLTVLFSLAAVCGCSTSGPLRPARPVLVGMALCPAPESPSFPALSPANYFDAPINVEALLIRDDIFREHIMALREAIRCYEAQHKASNARNRTNTP